MKSVMRTLFIEDNPDDFQLVARLLSKIKTVRYELVNSPTLTAVKKILKKNEFDVILLDLGLPDSQGMATFREVNRLSPKLPIIIVTDLIDDRTAVAAIEEGAQDYLSKSGLAANALSRVMLYAVERKRSELALKELAAIIEQTEEAIFTLASEGIITSWNKAAEKIYGYSPCEIVNHPISILCPPKYEDDIHEVLNIIKKGGKVIQYETYCQCEDGNIINISLTASPVLNAAGKTTGALVVSHNITQRKLLERHVTLQYRVTLALSGPSNLSDVINKVLHSIGEIMEFKIAEMWLLDQPNNVLRYFSGWSVKDNAQELIQANKTLTFHKSEGIPGAIWESKSPFLFMDLSKYSKPNHLSLLTSLGLTTCLGIPVLENDNILGVMLFYNGYIHKIDVNTSAMFKTIGESVGTFIHRKRVEEDLVYLSHHDALTGLANRTLLEDDLTLAISYAKRYKTKMALLYLDLDHFKEINDTEGHLVGDAILQETGKRIRQCVRESDVVSRFGGDEFVVLIQKVEDIEDAGIIAKKIIDAITKPFTLEKELTVTVSIGIAMYPEDGPSVEDLIKNSDIAMYNAKLSGRNSYQYSMPSMLAVEEQKKQFVYQLQHVINKNEFSLNYQPKVNLQTGAVAGLEALIRWNRADGEILLPGQFIPIAEENNLIIPIGEWVLNSVGAQIKKWKKQGLGTLSVAVNISANQLDLYLIDLISAVIKKYDINPPSLELEISESVLMKDTEKNIALISALKRLGIAISIDNFGTGYSSFSYLKYFVADAIKIDHSFLECLPKDTNCQSIVRGIIAMAKALNITTIAKGVERKEQLEFLKNLGCDQYQGYLFCRPLPEDELYQFLFIKGR